MDRRSVLCSVRAASSHCFAFLLNVNMSLSCLNTTLAILLTFPCQRYSAAIVFLFVCFFNHKLGVDVSSGIVVKPLSAMRHGVLCSVKSYCILMRNMSNVRRDVCLQALSNGTCGNDAVLQLTVSDRKPWITFSDFPLFLFGDSQDWQPRHKSSSTVLSDTKSIQ